MCMRFLFANSASGRETQNGIESNGIVFNLHKPQGFVRFHCRRWMGWTLRPFLLSSLRFPSSTSESQKEKKRNHQILEVRSIRSTPRKHRSSPRRQKLFAKESLEMWHQLSLESLAVRPVNFFTFFTTLSQRRCSDSCACNRRSKSSKAGGHRVPLDSVEITKLRSKFMLKSLERRGFQGVPVWHLDVPAARHWWHCCSWLLKPLCHTVGEWCWNTQYWEATKTQIPHETRATGDKCIRPQIWGDFQPAARNTDEVQSMLPLETDDTPWRSWKTVEWRVEYYLVPDQAF